MPRVPVSQEKLRALQEESQPTGGGTRVFNSAADFAADAPKQRRYKRKDFSAEANRFVKDVEDLIECVKDGQDPVTIWSTIDQRHLVALYAVFHREVYGVLPGEIAGDWQAACGAAGKLLRDEFESKPLLAVEYLRWAFAKEKKQEQKRSGEGTGWRLGWRWCFLKRELLTSFRVANKRASRPG